MDFRPRPNFGQFCLRLKSHYAHRSRSEPFRSENQKIKFAYFDETMIWEARKHIGASYFSIILAFYQDSILN